MIVLDVIYVALATIAVMVGLQVITFFVVRMFQPPEPKVVYVQAPPAIQSPPPMAPVMAPPPAFIQNPHEEIKLPEYEPRATTSDSLRVDPQLPLGLQETRPPGT